MTNYSDLTKKQLINEIINHDLISAYDAHNYQTENTEDISFFTCDYCLYSDYVGDTVTRSNQRSLFEIFKDKSGVEEITLGYSGVQTAFNYKSLFKWKKDDLIELLDILNDLQSYPCIDDEDLSLLETEIFSESWDNYISSDIISDLQKILETESENQPDEHTKEKLYNLSIDLDDENYIYDYNKELYKLLDICWIYSEKTNDYPIYETATSAYVDTEKVAAWIFNNCNIIYKPTSQKDITDYL